MKIGLDARVGRPISVGMATYMRELAARLPRVAPEFEYVTYTKGQNLGYADQITFPQELWRDKVDFTHFMSQYVPIFANRPFVFTIHDLIHMRFQPFFRAYIGPYYNLILKRNARRAARVITSDSRTVHDLYRYLDVDPVKVRVVSLAPRERFRVRVEPFKAERPYFLNVGNHRRHKDIPTLLRAWSSLPAAYEVDLYLTGADDLEGELQRHSTATRRAIALGDITDEQLASYYAGAVALVHPAMLEGFGLPFVEAMASGCPVIATQSSIPDPVRDVSLQFNVGGVEEAAAHMKRLLDDEAFRRTLIERGRNVVGALTWDRTARETADVYQEVAEELA
jgi:glycosyltransferase involved in cell wall biosynthesis